MSKIRVVESESVESHVFSWSRSRFSKLLESVFKTAGVGFQNCWSRFFKTAGVEVGSRNRFFKTAGVGVGKFVAITDSNIYRKHFQQSVVVRLPYTPFVTYTFHYILGNYFHN